MAILLVRHGETEWNRLHVLQGVLDVPLNDNGRAQAEKLAARLQKCRLTKVYSSHLSRARVTAEHIIMSTSSNQPELVLAIDERLAEFNSGVFAGMTQAEARKKYPREWQQYHADEEYVVPNGESFSGFTARVCDAFREITRSVEEGEGEESLICIVAHGGVLDCIQRVFLPGLTRASRCGNASLSRIVRANGNDMWQAEFWNDTTHLSSTTGDGGGADDII